MSAYLIINTPGTGNWTVPITGTYIIECIGGGVGGTQAGTFAPKGGGGGSYTKNTAAFLTAGTLVPYSVAAGYISQNGINQGAGGDTWVGSSNPLLPTALCFASGGNSYNGGTGTYVNGWTSFPGGDGGPTNAGIGPGGGGAGGPNGAGGNGGSSTGGTGDGGHVAAGASGTSMAGGLAGPGGGGAPNGLPAGQGQAGGNYGGGAGASNSGGAPSIPGVGLIVITFPVPVPPLPGPPPPPALYCVPFAIGFTYTSQGQILRPAAPQEAQTQSGPAQGKKRRMTYAAPLLFDAQGISMGVDFLKMRALSLMSPGGTVPLTVQQTFSGVYWGTVDATYNYDNMWCWQITRPYPCTVVSVECQLETNENL